MTLMRRVRAADPLGGRLPDAIAAPAPPDDPVAATSAPRRRPARGRRALVAVAAALAIVAVVVLAAHRPSGGGGRVVLATFAVEGLGGGPGTPAQQTGSLATLRDRVGVLGIGGWRVSTTGGRVTITCAGCARAGGAATARALAAPGHVALYDWERNVLGPSCRAAPFDAAVTGGPNAGTARAGLGRAAADRRARRCGDARVVRASDVATRWYVLRDRPALTGDEIARARAGADRLTHAPNVVVTYSASGARTMGRLFERLARRGHRAPDPSQHFAVVVDRRIVSVPYVDRFVANDGRPQHESEISGGFTPSSARTLAAIITSGQLPARLRATG